MDKQTLHTEQVKAKTMTYFLDLRSSEKAGPYLVMTQSKKDREGNFQNNRIHLFSSDLDAFSDAFEKVIAQFKIQLAKQEKSETKTA